MTYSVSTPRVVQLDASLDKLIHQLEQNDFALKLAIAQDDIEAIEKLDAETKEIESLLLQFECRSDYERKTLFRFLVNNYLLDSELPGMLPEGLVDRLKGLFR